MFTVYTAPGCRYCVIAKAMLKARGLSFTEIDLSLDTAKRDEFRANGWMTVPQIFVDGYHVGGSDDLREHLKVS